MKDPRIYTSRFWILSISAFLFITSFQIIIPILTDIVSGFGGTYEKGLPIVFFALAALISRPFSGSLVDKIGRKPVMLTGTIICILIGFVYDLANGLALFIFIRFMHGFAAGFTPVGNTAYMADICPPHRRGEAMGVMGMLTSLGFAFGPMLGKYIAVDFGLQAVYISSSVIALLSFVLVLMLPETKENTNRLNPKMFVLKKSEIFDYNVMTPFILMILTIYAFGSAQAIIIDHARALKFWEKDTALFFLIAAVTSILFRFVAGKSSDIYGRRNVMITGLFFGLAASVILALTHSRVLFMLGAVVYGVSIGINSPTIFAWCVDLADKTKLGRAMSTLYIAVEVGVIMGSLVSGIMLQYENGFTIIHAISAAMFGLGIILLLGTKRDRPPTTAQQLQGT